MLFLSAFTAVLLAPAPVRTAFPRCSPTNGCFPTILPPPVAQPTRSDETCRPIPGAQQTVSDSAVRWLIVGEQHGTNETPTAFADLVCAASGSREVVVAVEQPEREQDAINAFMISDGGSEAQTVFLRSTIWQNQFKDGRSSQAMFRLFQTLRDMRAGGRIQTVVAFQPTRRSSPDQYEQAMAERLKAAAYRNALVVVLVGNVHAMRTAVSFGGPSYLPMAGLLPRSETVTIDARPDGGVQWACLSLSACGPKTMTPPRVPHMREFTIKGPSEAPYSGVLYLGVPATASPPKIQPSLGALYDSK
jgi:hypothetical protein